MTNSFHDGEGPDCLSNKVIAGRGFSSGELPLETPAGVSVDAGKGGSESTFVHFRQLLQEGGMRLPSLGITGIDEHTARVSGEAGRGRHIPRFPPVYAAI